jgi:hypothetical protein
LPAIDGVAEILAFVKKITSNQTNRIGNREINGTPAVGFRFDVPVEALDRNPNFVGQVRGEIWVKQDDGLPMRIDTESTNFQGDTIREKISDMRWHVSPDESLFDLSVPAGWDLKRARNELTEYSDTRLAPGITLEIRPDGQPPLVAAGDVAGVVRVMQTSQSDSVIAKGMQITIDLKPAAAKRLHDFADAHPDKIFIVDFNGQIKAVTKLGATGTTQISFSLNWLNLSLAGLETEYFTTSMERNNK